MVKRAWVFMLIALGLAAGACGYGPTSPSKPDYGGQWTGTTAQTSSTINFTVSSDNRVTAIAIQYSFNGCSGAKTFASVNVPIGDIGSGIAQTADYTAGPAGGPDTTSVHFNFTSNTTATGTVAFVNYADCGSAGGTFSASKR
jgi:hypothetical protein